MYHKPYLRDQQWKILDPLSSTFVRALAAPAVMSTWHRNPSWSQRSCTHPDPPRVQGREPDSERNDGSALPCDAIIHSCSSPTASGSVVESTLARAVSRGRRSRPPERRRGRSLAWAAAVDGAKGGGARPRLVEPQQGVARTLAEVLHHAAERRDARRGGPTLPGAHAFQPQCRGQRFPGLRFGSRGGGHPLPHPAGLAPRVAEIGPPGRGAAR